MGKYTTGPVEIMPDIGAGLVVRAVDVDAIICTEIGLFSECGTGDAQLIAEAFNVAHETGRTPKELAEERGKLLAVLKDVRSELFLKIADKHDPKTAHNWPEIQRADAAIADAEDATP